MDFQNWLKVLLPNLVIDEKKEKKKAKKEKQKTKQNKKKRKKSAYVFCGYTSQIVWVEYPPKIK